MNVEQVASVLTERTKCLLPVHLYGQCVEMAPLETIAAKHDLPILEDCAQAHGSVHHGRIAGSMGRAAAFSFYPTKVLGAYGDGGATITADPEIDANLRRLRYYGMEKVYYVVQTPGHNSRLDEVQAEILRRKLTRLDDYVARRRLIATRYAEAFAGTDLVTPVTAPGNEHVYYVYVVRHPARDRIIELLKAHDIMLNISYPWPVHTQSGFAHLGYGKGSLPVTEEVAGQIFSLPMFPSLTDVEQERVIDTVRQVLAKV
jgi:aminotransferase EvaB